MKRAISIILVCAMILVGCTQQTTVSETNYTETTKTLIETATESGKTEEETDGSEIITSKSLAEFKEIVPNYNELSDPDLLRYTEDNIYSRLIAELDSDEYFVENVSAVYWSKEYIEELEYNSKKNIFFGYSLEDLDEQFQGTRYVFSLGDGGDTIVEAFEEYDDTYARVIKNTAIGTGVIIVCVTVSMVSAGAGAPAVSMVFAASAKTGATFAVSSGALSGIATAVITGTQTNDMSQAVKAGALAGSESFKWGAITGTIYGGITEGTKYFKVMNTLKGAELEGITMQQAAAMQMESGFPVDIIKQLHSMDEYNIYKDSGLVCKMVDGKLALVRDIDLNFKSELPNGEVVTNLERMARGYAPHDPITDKAYQLHHIGQKSDATLAVLTEAEHTGKGNTTILHMIGKDSEIDRPVFDTVREKFWKSFAESVK
ncbi:MAG: hypothetical protein HDR19_00500 [Lachnospiraceae bacterium]|nr:hypothetical protein [Lachnospiraceae bacterium]